MPGPLDEIQALLGGQGPPRSPVLPAVPGGGLLDLTPGEWAAFMRRFPMSDAGRAAPAQPFLGEWPLEMQGGWSKNRSRYNEPFQGRAILRHMQPIGQFMGEAMPPLRPTTGLPPQDELIKEPSERLLAGDTGIVARPYTGPQTGDPVINMRRFGTWDRAPGLVNDWNRPFIWENYKRLFEP